MTIQRDLKATTPRLRRTPPKEGNKGGNQRAMESCAASGHTVFGHFRGVTKMVVHGKGGLRGVNGEATQ